MNSQRTNKKPPLTERQTFTTGEVAILCECAPRTVGHWIDRGLLKGFVLPGGKDRRVMRESLVALLREHGMTFALKTLGEAEARAGL